MHVGQQKEAIDKEIVKRDQNAGNNGAKTTNERHIEIIDDILDDLLETEEEPPVISSDEKDEGTGLKYFISTKTKTLKTTVTSTVTLTSYHTCYKGMLD